VYLAEDQEVCSKKLCQMLSIIARAPHSRECMAGHSPSRTSAPTFSQCMRSEACIQVYAMSCTVPVPKYLRLHVTLPMLDTSLFQRAADCTEPALQALPLVRTRQVPKTIVSLVRKPRPVTRRYCLAVRAPATNPRAQNHPRSVTGKIWCTFRIGRRWPCLATYSTLCSTA
jgi:hypothetical protein